jgi:hypothetical protein
MEENNNLPNRNIPIVEEPSIQEIKPNFWIKKTKSGRYYQLYPIKKDPNKKEWKNNINWKNLLVGGNPQLFIFIIILLLIALAYQHDINGLKGAYEDPCSYCAEYQNIIGNVNNNLCSQENEAKGLCTNFNVNDTYLEKFKSLISSNGAE